MQLWKLFYVPTWQQPPRGVRHAALPDLFYHSADSVALQQLPPYDLEADLAGVRVHQAALLQALVQDHVADQPGAVGTGVPGHGMLKVQRNG